MPAYTASWIMIGAATVLWLLTATAIWTLQ
jgi:hypothetical protein